MKTYSKELHRDVLEMADHGATTRQIGVELNVSEAFVRRVKQHFRERGQVGPKPTRDRVPTWRPHAAWIEAKIAGKPDLYIRELKELALEELGWEVSETTLRAALKALGVTRKKRPSSPPNATAPTSPPAGRSGSRRKKASTPTG